MPWPTRQEAWDLLNTYTKNPNLVKHALGVEACVRAYARHLGEDEEKWGVTALLHDYDWEIHPNLDEHPLKGSHLLREKGYPEEMIYAILSHAERLNDRYPRVHLLDKVLFACDEISGFIVAVALVKGKSLFNVDVESVTRRLKQPNFARGVSRDDVETGLREIGLPAEEHFDRCIKALQGIAGELGLTGA